MVASPKKIGGLGIRKLQELNLAYMVKLGWRLQHEKNSIWARTLSGKYHHGRSASFSNAWKGIRVATPFLEAGTIKLVRSGKTTRFWMDNWIAPYPLRQLLSTAISLPVLYATVNEYWDEGRGWKWELLTVFYLSPCCKS